MAKVRYNTQDRLSGGDLTRGLEKIYGKRLEFIAGAFPASEFKPSKSIEYLRGIYGISDGPTIDITDGIEVSSSVQHPNLTFRQAQIVRIELIGSIEHICETLPILEEVCKKYTLGYKEGEE